MPWKESRTVDERMALVVRHQAGERVTDLCREFGISRKTAYKFLDRYKEFGAQGLEDQSRAPITHPAKVTPQVEKMLLQLKERYPTWGARKFQELMRAKLHKAPSSATLHRILQKNGKVESRKRRKTNPAFRSSKIRETTSPNEIWAIDFKGEFQTQNGTLCYPLTITDHFSRYLLGCEALSGTESGPALEIMGMTFKEHGLPNAILSDNGTPFGAPKGLFGLSQMSLWLMRLGVDVLRIEPGHPEQNGRHERMHLTLKRETARPSSKNMLQQQDRFDQFRAEYNNERPHEALAMKTPSAVWEPSRRVMPNTLPEPNYEMADRVCIVNSCGSVILKPRKRFVIGRAFIGQPIALTEEDDGIWRVNFMKYVLGYVDETTSIFEPLEHINLSPM